MEKIVSTLVAADVFLSIAVIAIIISLSSFMKMDNERDLQAQASVQNTLLTPNKTVVAPKTLKNVAIALSDGKIDPIGFSVYTDENVTLAITNNSKEGRDLKIGELNFDSGIIKPGETKKAGLGALPEQQGTYEYKSTAIDGSQEFSGTLIVLTK